MASPAVVLAARGVLVGTVRAFSRSLIQFYPVTRCNLYFLETFLLHENMDRTTVFRVYLSIFLPYPHIINFSLYTKLYIIVSVYRTRNY